jgi:hypothetical protein
MRNNQNNGPRAKRGNPIIHAWDAATDEARYEFFNAREYEIYAARHSLEQLSIDAYWRETFQWQ